MLHCVHYPLDCCVNVHELLLRLYANRESRKASLPAVRVSPFFLFLRKCECDLRSRYYKLMVTSLTDFFCSSECENARQRALCSFPEANLSLSTGERVSAYISLLGLHRINEIFSRS